MKGKIIIVTGGSGLLGREILADIIRKGGLAINLDLSNDGVYSTDFFKCDITSEHCVKQVLYEVRSKYTRIDGLVNNAYPRTSDWGIDFEDMSIESLRVNVDWQLNSYLNFCKLIVPIMRENSGGSVVNMSSIYGVVGNNFSIYEGTGIEPPVAYSAIKGGLINVTRFLASKYGKEQIRFNCVSPGGIFDNQSAKFVNAYEKLVPMKRMGRPDDIAPSVSFLLSDESKYITGQNIIVDGGWTCI
jgi:NAD(P)-dependent dehydrogenase (short-subunit alcohol dehydrogenase family)